MYLVSWLIIMAAIESHLCSILNSDWFLISIPHTAIDFVIYNSHGGTTALQRAGRWSGETSLIVLGLLYPMRVLYTVHNIIYNIYNIYVYLYTIYIIYYIMHLRMKLFCIQYEQLRFHMYNARTRPVRYNIHINEDIIFGWKKIKK